MELLLQCISPSPPLLTPISHLSLRRSIRSKFWNKGNALAATARRSMVVMADARPEKEKLAPKVEKNDNLEPEVERLTAEELEKIAEAVMEGKDEGRTPLDYDRRARIFCQSSRVFRDVNKVSSLKP
ncbi:uncharacterized protein LOC110099573 [Dendrobium catenatum]|uniref:uncharacterized protein LOC110099573 n=1 Tax=Dendrobium catenatum TaxID=906689 RepID=UPI0009F73E66|nr:uncharacterized protein LOC110099573 [Dendrobium catenatum]